MAQYESNPYRPLKRLGKLLRLERREILHIYFFAGLSGIIYLSLPLGIQAIMGLLFGGVLSTSLIVLISLVVAGVLLNGILQVMQMRITEKIQQRIFTFFALEFSYRIPRMDLMKIDRYFLPELTNRFFDTPAIQKGISKVLIEIPTASIQIIFGLILLSLYHPVFIAFSLLLVACIALIIRLTGPSGIETSLKESNYKYEVAHWLEEVARTVRTLKFTGSIRFPLQKTDKLLNSYLDARDAHFRILLVQYWGFIAFKVIITAALLILGSVLLIDQKINLGQFVAAEIVIIMVLNSVEKLINSLEVIYDLLTSLEKTGKVLDSELEKSGSMRTAEICQASGLEIELDQVAYHFPDNSNPTLHQLNLKVEAGQKVCISGKQGAGKSTLLRLLAGEFSDLKGNFLINRFPIGNLDLQDFRKNIGIVMSKADLFPGTLAENIMMGDEIPPNDIMHQATLLGLNTFIESSKNGLNTYIETQGRKLPKSTIARILLCRALVRKPKLLLIEDCWSNLDSESKSTILNCLLHHTPGITLIASSNDPEFKAHCNENYVLENGRLLRSSNHTKA